MKFSRVISRVRWFSLVETNVSKTISALVLRVVEIIWVRWTTQSFYLYPSKLRSQGCPLAIKGFSSGHCSLCLVQPSGWLASSLSETRIGSENFIILTRQESIKSYIASQEVPHFLWNQNVHYHVHDSLPILRPCVTFRKKLLVTVRSY
jgi:hypothetical protein